MPKENFRQRQSKLDKEKQKEQLKSLQSKFEPVQYHPDSEIKTSKVNKDKIEKFEKRIELLQKEIVELRKQLKITTLLNKDLKTTIFDQKHILQDYIDKYDDLLSIYNNLKNKQNDNHDLVEEVIAPQQENKKEITELRHMQNTINQLRNKNYKLQSDIIELTSGQRLNYYEKEINALDELVKNYQNQMAFYSKQIDELNTKLLSYKNIIDQKEFIIEDAITFLNNILSKNNIYQFIGLNKLIKKYYSYNRNSSKKKNKKSIIIEEIPEESLYGYINQTNDKYYFSDIQGNIYLISCCARMLQSEFIEDVPARASIINGYARIEKLYFDDNVNAKETSRARKNVGKVKQINKEINEHKIVYPKEYTILIVGSRNKKSYMDKLLSCDLNPIWFDSHEEHPSRLEEKYSSADVVIICTSHSKHYTLDIINKEDPKVELIERDNVDTIFHRVRYALIRLGLIQIG